LQIEYSSLLDVRLLKGIESVPGAFSTPSAETCKGGSLAGKTVALDNNEGKIECQKPGMVPNNTKDQEASKIDYQKPGMVPKNTKDQEARLGTDLSILSILFPCR
jgi:hypothetical protein